ncbi:MAG: ricin-type beta-trefoil lectin domain protein [Rhizobiaceae bacterium]
MVFSRSVAAVMAAGSLVPTLVSAAATQIKTPAPVIYLADNLDEADGLGWCIDTVGRGLSDRLHAHSCKSRGGDVQFRFDQTTGQIASVTFEGKCMARHNPPDTSKPLRLIQCNDSPQQSFVYQNESQTFRPADEPNLCLTAGSSSRKAGPFLSRNLGFATCSENNSLLQRWVIKK